MSELAQTLISIVPTSGLERIFTSMAFVHSELRNIYIKKNSIKRLKRFFAKKT